MRRCDSDCTGSLPRLCPSASVDCDGVDCDCEKIAARDAVATLSTRGGDDGLRRSRSPRPAIASFGFAAADDAGCDTER
jgi:hypothetical protein